MHPLTVKPKFSELIWCSLTNIWLNLGIRFGNGGQTYSFGRMS